MNLIKLLATLKIEYSNFLFVNTHGTHPITCYYISRNLLYQPYHPLPTTHKKWCIVDIVPIATD